MADDMLLLKILVIGESAVGKSALLLRYTENTFTTSFMTTIGVDFKNKIIEIDGRKVKLQIWDTAGQEKFKSITKAYYRGAHGILVVFDISNMDSFSHTESWIESIRDANTDIDIILIGNKADLPRQVPKDEAQALADKFGVRYYETSAKENENVSKAFEDLAEIAFRRVISTPQKNETKKLEKVEGDTKKGCC